MANLLLRNSRGGLLAQQLLRKSLPLVSGANIQKQNLAVTPVHRERAYGPTEGSQPAYTSHWSSHRYQMISMVPLIPLALAIPHPALDLLLSGSLVLHSHWGIQGMLSDYLHGKTLKTISTATLMLLSISAMAGLCYLNYNDIGFAKTVRKVYSEL